MEKVGIPNKRPAVIIGTNNVKALHEAGYRIVPSVATSSMKNAAILVMRKRQTLGFPWVSNAEKAGIRWEAMLSSWKNDYDGMVKGLHIGPEPEPPIRWHWKLGKLFEMRIGWLIEKHIIPKKPNKTQRDLVR